MIGSSLNLFRFILVRLHGVGFYPQTVSFQGAHHELRRDVGHANLEDDEELAKYL